MTRAPRSPGPALKPFIYALAFESASPSERFLFDARRAMALYAGKLRSRLQAPSRAPRAADVAEPAAIELPPIWVRPIFWRACMARRNDRLPKTPAGPRDRPWRTGHSLTIWRAFT